MSLTPLPASAFDKADTSLTVSFLAWCGIVSGAVGCTSIALRFFSPSYLPSLGMLLGSPAALTVALGLRSRRNWARLSYIAALALGFAGIAFRSLTGHGPTLVFVAASALINGLIIAKLCSEDVRAEFGAL